MNLLILSKYKIAILLSTEISIDKPYSLLVHSSKKWWSLLQSHSHMIDKQSFRWDIHGDSSASPPEQEKIDDVIEENNMSCRLCAHLCYCLFSDLRHWKQRIDDSFADVVIRTTTRSVNKTVVIRSIFQQKNVVITIIGGRSQIF